MEREHGKSLEELVEERTAIAQEITTADAAGETDKLDELHKRHEQLTQMIEEMPNEDEEHKLAA